MLRPAFVILHRFVGLAIAGFLFVSGLTGAVISWDHELDEWLNPHLTKVASRGAFLPPLSLAQQVERADPHARVNYVPLLAEAGHTLALGVEARVDPASGTLYEIGYNQAFVDPVTGKIVGKREWGAAWPISRETIVSFLYVLHYSLHIPAMWGIESWGLWLMGGVALLWTVDCFVGFYLTLPIRKRAALQRPAAVMRQLSRGWWQRWKPAWMIKRRGSPYRIAFDMHRAFSLWLWVFLFVLALSGASLNLYAEVAQPIVSFFSSFTPTPWDTRPLQPKEQPVEPLASFAEIVGTAEEEARRRGWSEPAGDIYYASQQGIYAVGFFQPGGDHGAAGVGPPNLYYDEAGRPLGDFIPWRGTAGDLFLQIQFPLHSGRIAGVPGRILISAMGIVVAMLSVTGVVIWYRKRRARLAIPRLLHRRRDETAGLSPAE